VYFIKFDKKILFRFLPGGKRIPQNGEHLLWQEIVLFYKAFLMGQR
jgi:hypothetical protein